MEAELAPDTGFGQKLFNRLERSFARVFFMKVFLKGDAAAAAKVGVAITGKDRALFGITNFVIIVRMLAYGVADRIPGIRDWSDGRLISKLQQQLAGYGHAEFTTDAAAYRPARGEAVHVG
jgi:hypothetical protein